MLTSMELNFEDLQVQKRKKNGTFFVLYADDGKILVTI